jgi:hypothetical protein
MPPIVSELIKFSVARGFKLDSANFARLRQAAVTNGVKEQYYGTCTDTPNTLLWIIRAYLTFLTLDFSFILAGRVACGERAPRISEVQRRCQGAGCRRKTRQLLSTICP